jgi:hypothetical protein
MGKKSKKREMLKATDIVGSGIVGGAFTQTVVGSGFGHAVGHALGHTMAGNIAFAAGAGLAHVAIGPPLIIASAAYLGIRYLCRDED